MPPFWPGYFVMTAEVPYRCRRMIGQDRGGGSWFCPARVNTPPCPRYDSPSECTEGSSQIAKHQLQICPNHEPSPLGAGLRGALDHIRQPASRGVAQGSRLFLARLLSERARTRLRCSVNAVYRDKRRRDERELMLSATAKEAGSNQVRRRVEPGQTSDHRPSLGDEAGPTPVLDSAPL